MSWMASLMATLLKPQLKQSAIVTAIGVAWRGRDEGEGGTAFLILQPLTVHGNGRKHRRSRPADCVAKSPPRAKRLSAPRRPLLRAPRRPHHSVRKSGK